MVSKEPLSTVAPQACIEPCWRITQHGSIHQPLSSSSISRLIQTCAPLLTKPLPAAGDGNTGYCRIVQRDTTICSSLLPLMPALCLLFTKCNNAAVSCLQYCSGTDSRRLLQSISHRQTAVSLCACVCFPHRAQTMSHMSVMWAITFQRTTPVWLITSPDKVGPFPVLLWT